MAIWHSRPAGICIGNACVRLRSDFHDFIKPENVSFRRCSGKSAFSGFMKSENHLARPRTAHFQANTGGAAVPNGHTGLCGYRRAPVQILRESLRFSAESHVETSDYVYKLYVRKLELHHTESSRRSCTV